VALDSTTSITLFGFTVWDEGTREQFNRETPSCATRTLVCAWGDRVGLINAIRSSTGYVALTTSGSRTIVQYVAPANYPDAPWLYVDTIEVEGLAGETGLSVGTNGLVAYKYARIRIIYKSLPYQEGVETGVFSVDYGAEFFTLPSQTGSLTFTDSTGGMVPTDQNPALRITVVTFKQTRMNLPSIPTSQIMAATDCVNSAAFQGAAVGTVLFAGASSQRRLFAGGSPGWDMTYSFSYRSVGWNVAFDPNKGTFRPVQFTGNSQTPYSQYDFNQLFL
jgi:hypothetical protein